MAEEVNHVLLADSSADGSIDGDVVITAIKAFVDTMAELAKRPDKPGVPNVQVHGLSLGSLHVELRYGDTFGRSEYGPLARVYAAGWDALEKSPGIPLGFSRSALEAMERLATLFLEGKATGLRLSGSSFEEVQVTQAAARNIVDSLGSRFTDLGSIEGRLTTISLASRPIFNVRDDATGQLVSCAIPGGQLDKIRDLLDERVIVFGDLTYTRVGIPSEVSPVHAVMRLPSKSASLADFLAEDRRATIRSHLRPTWRHG